MPVYDNNGTTNYETGGLYDNNGTTNYQIGQVYDHDGTANHLIYTAEQDVFNYGATPYGWGGYSSQDISEWAQVNGDHINVTATGTGFSRAYTNAPISLSGYSTLNMYVYTNDASYVHGVYGIELLNSSSGTGARVAFAEQLSSANTASTYQTVSLSLAGHNTGSYYIGVFCNAADSAGNGGVGIKAYRIWLT